MTVSSGHALETHSTDFGINVHRTNTADWQELWRVEAARPAKASHVVVEAVVTAVGMQEHGGGELAGDLGGRGVLMQRAVLGEHGGCGLCLHELHSTSTQDYVHCQSVTALTETSAALLVRAALFIG